MRPDQDAPWRCPRCRGVLEELRDGSTAEPAAASLRCIPCGASYEVIGGIPDFRIEAPAWIDIAADREAARELARHLADGELRDLRELVHSVFSSRGPMGESFAELRTRRVLDAPARLGPEVVGWLDECTRGLFIDLGCGPGALLAAAAREGRCGIGIDVCLTWLVVARVMIESHGGRALLASAFAEALPLADGAVDGVVALDVVEHVAHPAPFLTEIDRVTRPGGAMALATPNRFSLAPEPHVSVWGVGWLPRRWQKRYVGWRSDIPYDYVRLLSPWELSRLVARHTDFVPRLDVPTVPAGEIAAFPPAKAALARGYNRLAVASWARPLTLALGPFFHLVARRRGPASTSTAPAAASPAPSPTAPRRPASANQASCAAAPL